MEEGMAALSIRRDHTPGVLRKLAKSEADARVARRMLAIANALDGMSREDAARSAGMDRQTLRDWVIRYNEHGVDGLADRWGNGRPPKLRPQEKVELVANARGRGQLWLCLDRTGSLEFAAPVALRIPPPYPRLRAYGPIKRQKAQIKQLRPARCDENAKLLL
jgi:transposase-like protein